MVYSPRGCKESDMNTHTHSSLLAWENPMDRGTWRAVVPGVTKSQTRLK